MYSRITKLAFVLLLCFNAAFAQQMGADCRLDKNLSVTFPRVPDSGRMKGCTVKYVNTELTSYLALVNDSLVSMPKSEKDFKLSLEGMVEGFQRNAVMSSYRQKVTDTTIGGAKGKYLHLTNPSGETVAQEVFVFITSQEGQMYLLQVYASNEALENPVDIHAFFKSAKFYGQPYEKKKPMTAFEQGEMVGYYSVPVILVILLVVFIVRRVNRKNNNKGKAMVDSL